MTYTSSNEPTPAPKRVFVFGASGHAKVVLNILQLCGGFIVAGLLDDFKPLGFECAGIPVLGGITELPEIASAYLESFIVVAVGDNWRRAQIVDQIRALAPKTKFVSAVHPSAQIAQDVSIGDGSVVMAGAVVNPGSTIGQFCIVNTRASLDHDCRMGDFSSLCPGVITGGNVSIGAYSNIGMGALLLPEIEVGEHSVIGAGALVLKSVPERMVAYGAPARLIHSRKPGDRYLTGPVPENKESKYD